MILTPPLLAFAGAAVAAVLVWAGMSTAPQFTAGALTATLAILGGGGWLLLYAGVCGYQDDLDGGW